MATELADRVAIAAAIRLITDRATLSKVEHVFVPATDASDPTLCLWIEDAELDGVRGWNVSVKHVDELAELDATPLAPLEPTSKADEPIPGQVDVYEVLGVEPLKLEAA